MMNSIYLGFGFLASLLCFGAFGTEWSKWAGLSTSHNCYKEVLVYTNKETDTKSACHSQLLWPSIPTAETSGESVVSKVHDCYEEVLVYTNKETTAESACRSNSMLAETSYRRRIHYRIIDSLGLEEYKCYDTDGYLYNVINDPERDRSAVCQEVGLFVPE